MTGTYHNAVCHGRLFFLTKTLMMVFPFSVGNYAKFRLIKFLNGPFVNGAVLPLKLQQTNWKSSGHVIVTRNSVTFDQLKWNLGTEAMFDVGGRKKESYVKRLDVKFFVSEESFLESDTWQ